MCDYIIHNPIDRSNGNQFLWTIVPLTEQDVGILATFSANRSRLSHRLPDLGLSQRAIVLSHCVFTAVFRVRALPR
jgi:hypothetical protein